MFATNISSGWQQCKGCLFFIGHFPQQNPIIIGYVVERDLQFEASYASWPTCSGQWSKKVSWVQFESDKVGFSQPNKKRKKERAISVLTLRVVRQLSPFRRNTKQFLGLKVLKLGFHNQIQKERKKASYGPSPSELCTNSFFEKTAHELSLRLGFLSRIPVRMER